MLISIAIVEDDRAVRASLVGILQRAVDCRCVGDYASAEEALRKLPVLRPDVIVMDINLPDMSGVECVRQLSQLSPAAQILMLTVHEDPESIFNSLVAGASGYLLKPVRAAELVAAVKDIFRGGAPMTSSIARKVVQSFKQARSSRGETENLSPREQDVLNLLVKGYSYKETADLLGISYATVHMHIEQIYQKLHVQSRGQAVAKMIDTYSSRTMPKEQSAPHLEAKPSDPGPPLRVCMVEGNRRVRDIFQEFINQSERYQCIKTFSDAESALEELPRLKPDLVLMNVRLPGMSGIECIKALKKMMPALTIVILTASDEDEFLFDSLKAGANGYLLQRTPGPKLLEALQEACFGGLPLAPHMAAKVGEYFKQLANTDVDLERLTPREQEALQHLSDGFRYKEIADRMHIGLDTVRKHVQSIYVKFHVNSRTEAVVKYLRR